MQFLCPDTKQISYLGGGCECDGLRWAIRLGGGCLCGNGKRRCSIGNSRVADEVGPVRAVAEAGAPSTDELFVTEHLESFRPLQQHLQLKLCICHHSQLSSGRSLQVLEWFYPFARDGPC